MKTTQIINKSGLINRSNNSNSINDQTMDTLVFIYLDGVQFFVGFIFNTLVFSICMRKRLRKTSGFWLIALCSLSNTLILTFHSLPRFLNEIIGQRLEFQSLEWCKISTYLEIVFYNTSSWYLVISTLEIFLTTKYTYFRNRYSTLRNVLIVGACVPCFFLTICSPLPMFNGFNQTTNNHQVSDIVCFSSPNFPDLFRILSIVNAFIYSIIPSALLIASNFLLVRELLKSKRKVANRTKTTTLTSLSSNHSNELAALMKNVVVFTSLFVFISFSRSMVILVVAFRFEYDYYEADSLISKVTTMTNFYYATSFVILFFKNKAFQNETKKLLQF